MSIPRGNQSEIARLVQELKTERQRKATLRNQSAEAAVSHFPSAAEQTPGKAPINESEASEARLAQARTAATETSRRLRT
jgi:hypothetical protein